MRRSKREEQKTDVRSEKKKHTTVGEKNSLLFFKFCLKKFKIKNKLLKNYGCTTEKDELL